MLIRQRCSNTRTYTVCHAKYTMPVLNQKQRAVPISCSLILMPPLYPFPYELHYLTSQLNRENLGQLDPRETFQVTAHNTYWAKPCTVYRFSPSRCYVYTAPASQIPEVLRIGPIVVADLPYMA